MLRGMAKQVSVTIVGPGSFGTALAKALHEAGIPVAEIVYRNGESARRAKKLAREAGAKAVEFEEWLGSRSGAPPERARAPVPTLIWLCVGDSVIAKTAAAMASAGSWKAMTVFHSSGALTSDELGPLRRAGAKVASVHPMMTFVRSAAASMKGASFALEGDEAATAVARGMVRQLAGESFEIKKKDKPLYHALGAFVSPLIIAQMAAVERIGRELGFDGPKTRRIVGPILQQTIRNYIDHGPAAAFSGPIVRGDIATVKKHLAALKRVRGAKEIYRALAKMAVEELPSKNSVAIRKAIR
jgi:predicted short-subunit dehydrogenase-like oxidoreductase (DUF2520 family)